MATTNVSEANEITEQFERFLKTYYWDEIGELLQAYPKDQQSLEIEWGDLYRHDEALASDVQLHPNELLEYADEALSNLDVPVDVDLSGANVRLVGLPEESNYNVGAYRTNQRSELISITGQVARRTSVKPKATLAAWECERCGTLSKIPQTKGARTEPHECQGCERQGPFTMNYEQSEFVDFQQLRVQRPPEQATGGTSDYIDVNLEGDLTGRLEAGDRVDLPGVLRMRPDGDDDEPLFDYYLEAHSIEPKETSYEDIEVRKYLDEVRELASDTPFETLIDTLAPDIHGHELIKEAIIVQLFGGVRAEYPTGTADRGSIHILLLGDPGTAKSQILRATHELSPRSTFASGKGTSAAGLTAGVKADDFGQERYSLQAGALVTANEGLACIDEIDKVDEETRSSMHTALEQQVVEVDKIIQASLPARTSLLAAGNPKYGRFDIYEPIADQITLEPTLMSRFDLMFMLQDEVDEESDREIADHILESKDAATRVTHNGYNGDEIAEMIDPDVETEVVRAWIAYARQNIHPTFANDEVKRRIRENFVEFRSLGADEDSPVPVTFRKLEAIRRLAEASARVRLSNEIEMEDIERAQRLVGKSMADVGRDPETGEFDADAIETGTPKSQKERVKTLEDLIRELQKEHEYAAPRDEILERASELGIDQTTAEHELEKLLREGKIYSPRDDEHYRLTTS